MAISDDLRKAMQATNERFCLEVLGKGDFEVLDHVYTAGAKILPPSAPMMEGRTAIKEFWKAAVANLGITGATLTSLDVETSGDSAVEIGQAELQLGDSGTASAKYIVHWKQEFGEWLWDKDIWNMN